LEIGVEKDTVIGKPKKANLTKSKDTKPIAFYGTSNHPRWMRFASGNGLSGYFGANVEPRNDQSKIYEKRLKTCVRRKENS
jgi:hypothetical protein